MHWYQQLQQNAFCSQGASPGVPWTLLRKSPVQDCLLLTQSQQANQQQADQISVQKSIVCFCCPLLCRMLRRRMSGRRLRQKIQTSMPHTGGLAAAHTGSSAAAPAAAVPAAALGSNSRRRASGGTLQQQQPQQHCQRGHLLASVFRPTLIGTAAL